MKELNKIFNEIEKIASDFNIKEADSVTLTFKKDFGILKFKNAVDQTATAADPYNPLPSSTADTAVPQDPNKDITAPSENIPEQKEITTEKVDTEEKKPEEEKKDELSPEIKELAEYVESTYGDITEQLESIKNETRDKMVDSNTNPQQVEQEMNTKAEPLGDRLEQYNSDPKVKQLMDLLNSQKPEDTNMEKQKPEQTPPTQEQPVVPA